jgi:hypothetical protein
MPEHCVEAFLWTTRREALTSRHFLYRCVAPALRVEVRPGPRAREALNYFLGLRGSANSCALLADTRSAREFFHIVGGNRG